MHVQAGCAHLLGSVIVMFSSAGDRLGASPRTVCTLRHRWFCYSTTSKSTTRVTRSVPRAMTMAFVLAAAVSTVPRATPPWSVVSTLILLPSRIVSSPNFALTFAVIQPSLNSAPVDRCGGRALVRDVAGDDFRLVDGLLCDVCREGGRIGGVFPCRGRRLARACGASEGEADYARGHQRCHCVHMRSHDGEHAAIVGARLCV